MVVGLKGWGAEGEEGGGWEFIEAFFHADSAIRRSKTFFKITPRKEASSMQAAHMRVRRKEGSHDRKRASTSRSGARGRR